MWRVFSAATGAQRGARLQKCLFSSDKKLRMPTPIDKIERVQKLSAEERLRQPSPEDWLAEQDRKSGALDESAPPPPSLPDGDAGESKA